VNLWIGAVTVGLILTLLALGVLVAYRVYDVLDLTAEGAYGLGAAVAAALLVQKVPPIVATALGGLAGAAAGTVTGLLHTRLRVNVVLAGILISAALYSINLYVMNGGDRSLATEHTLVDIAEAVGKHLSPPDGDLTLLGTAVSARNWMGLLLTLVVVAGAAIGLDLFFRTDLGLAMRATGDNPAMARALGIRVNLMLVLGLAVANGLIGLSGAVFAQYIGFVNIQMGIGILVTGLASVMIGESLIGRGGVGRQIIGALAGAVVYRVLIAAALNAGLDANALKLVSAVFVLAAMIVPAWIRRTRASASAREVADA
jgi:putative ABC transport system permease protein